MNVDITKIAEQISRELNATYLEDVKSIKDKVKEQQTTNDKIVVLLNSLALAVKNHAERFTVRLVKEVVKEINKN